VSDERVGNCNERDDTTDKRAMKNILMNKKLAGFNRIFRIFQLIILLLVVQFVGAQQLVFNGSFEDVNICNEYHSK